MRLANFWAMWLNSSACVSRQRGVLQAISMFADCRPALALKSALLVAVLLSPIRAVLAQTEKAQTEKAQTEKAQTEKAQTEKAQTEKAQTEKAQTEKAQTEKAQTESAQTENDCEPDCIAVGDWEFGIELGYSHIPNPIAGGDDLRLPMLFRFSFYGEKFFLETGTFGYTIWETPHQRLNLIATPNLDYFYFAESGSASAVLTRPFQPFIPVEEFWGPPEYLDERKLTYLGGVEYSAFSGPWQVQLKAGGDISVGHDGYEVWLNGKHTWQHGRTSLYTSIGAVYRDAKLANYYYGVREADTWQFWYHYSPGASWSTYASFNASARISASSSGLVTSRTIEEIWYSFIS